VKGWPQAHVADEISRAGGRQFYRLAEHGLKIGIASMYRESNQAAC
jgi:hypothetical protein